MVFAPTGYPARPGFSQESHGFIVEDSEATVAAHPSGLQGYWLWEEEQALLTGALMSMQHCQQVALSLPASLLSQQDWGPWACQHVRGASTWLWVFPHSFGLHQAWQQASRRGLLSSACTFLDGQHSADQLRSTMQQLKQGRIKLLLLTAEQFSRPSFLNQLDSVSGLGLLLQEAHWSLPTWEGSNGLRTLAKNWPHINWQAPLLALMPTLPAHTALKVAQFWGGGKTPQHGVDNPIAVHALAPSLEPLSLYLRRFQTTEQKLEALNEQILAPFAGLSTLRGRLSSKPGGGLVIQTATTEEAEWLFEATRRESYPVWLGLVTTERNTHNSWLVLEQFYSQSPAILIITEAAASWVNKAPGHPLRWVLFSGAGSLDSLIGSAYRYPAAPLAHGHGQQVLATSPLRLIVLHSKADWQFRKSRLHQQAPSKLRRWGLSHLDHYRQWVCQENCREESLHLRLLNRVARQAVSGLSSSYRKQLFRQAPCGYCDTCLRENSMPAWKQWLFETKNHLLY